MKYFNLIQIAQFLQKFNKIDSIKRVGDNVFLVKFSPKFDLIFDLNSQNSAIYQANFTQNKIYKAPFDVILQKRLNSAKIEEVFVPQNNRILIIKTNHTGSYKEIKTTIFFEFTGRFTNVIITDENLKILEALSHYENENRVIKVGKTLTLLKPFEIKEKNCDKIVNFEEFFANEFKRLNDKNLQNLKNQKLLQIDKKILSISESLNSLESKEILEQKAEIFQKKAGLLISNLHILQDFQRKFELVDFDGRKFQFELENSPKISANEFYKISKKLKQKAQNIEIENQNLSQKLEFLQNLRNLIKNSNEISELNIFSPKKHNKNLQENSDYIENFFIGEYKILVGKNEKANEILLKNSKKDDWWFHLKNLPSSHIIVKTNKQNLSEEIIKMAAKICVNFSCKFAGVYEVDFTQRKNIKIINKAFVNYTNFKTTTALKQI